LIPFLEEGKKYKLIYLISDERLNVQIKNLQLVDVKTRLRKKIRTKYLTLDENIAEYTGEQNDQLKKLALQSGIYSRFKIDQHFTNNEFEKLYLKWIEDSINKTIADKVIINKGSKNNCIGFVTLKFKENFSEIGLIAVDKGSRGEGVGKELLASADYYTRNNGLNKIEVVTQFENQPAMRLYERSGYKIISKKYIYHLWN
jgi:dTDP-4-amino-4,6-dideoxy-D-galactose acyltransferase